MSPSAPLAGSETAEDVGRRPSLSKAPERTAGTGAETPAALRERTEAPAEPVGLAHSIYGFIWYHSKRQQLWVVLITLLSFPFLWYSLDLPRLIVNRAIGGSAEGRHFRPVEIFGYSFDQIPYLMLLSGAFLGLVLINGAFKYYINVYKGQLGERMLRRLRYELYCRVLRFPLPHFRKMSQGEIIPMITAEVEPLGGFIGDAFAQPVFQGGTLLVYLGFIFYQDPLLGAAATALYPFQGWLIPRLQRKVNQLGKQRVRTVRQLADKVGESVSGIVEIHTHDAAHQHLADFAHRLGNIYDIRFEIYRRKFFVKFLNNFINQLTPFFFYAIGGYLVIMGDLSFGALVAVLAAYKDLAGPWKELLDYYQQKEDIRIKYEQVVEQFQPPDLIPMTRLTTERRLEGPFPAALTLSNVGYAEDNAPTALDGITLSLDTRKHIALLGTAGDGRDDLMLILARLLLPTAGRVRLGDLDYTELPESVTGRAIAYIGPHSYMFTDTLRANLIYGLKHRPLREPERDEQAQTWRRRRAAEAAAAGNTDFDTEADWIDYESAGAANHEELRERGLAALRAADMEGDVYRMGLNGAINTSARAEVAEKMLHARAAVRARLAEDPALGELVELFDAGRYNSSATVAENLLFGTPVGPAFATEALATHPYVLQVLDKVGLTDDFVRIGSQVAQTMIELFADLPPGHEFFEQFSFIASDELPEFQPLVARVSKDGITTLKAEDRARLMALPFKLIVSRHRLDLIDAVMRDRLLEARHVFAADLPAGLRPSVEFFDIERYNAASTLQDNILFGKVRYGQSGGSERVQALIGEIIDELGLRQTVITVGLDHSVGVGGARLSASQRQKLALARALLRRPALLILNEATSSLDGASQAVVHANIREWCQGTGLIWAPHRPSLARDLDEVVVLRSGRVAAQGRFADLDRDGSPLHQLLATERATG